MSLPYRILAIALIVLFLLVALLEVVPRVVSIPGLRLADLDPVAEQVKNANVRPHPYMAYTPMPDYRSKPEAVHHRVSHNSLGFRGPETSWAKPEGVYRIVCLGGSSTYGHGPSSNATTWPARLQTMLNEQQQRQVEVINGGCRGYSSFESLANLAFRMLDFEPDLVLVYHTINDMRCALYKQPSHDNTHWRAVWKTSQPSFMENSNTFLFLRRHLTDYVANQRDIGTYVIVDYDGSVDSYAWPEGQNLGFESFHKNLDNIVTLAEANGARVLLSTQALRTSDIKGVSRDDQLRAFEYMTQIVKDVATERDLALVDARAALEAEGSEDLFTHEVHLTDAGADLLASTFATAILEAGFLER